MCERVRAQLTARGPTGTGSQVDNETSQRQILEMYRKGGAYNGQEIPWDVRKVQPAVEQLEREGVFKGVVLDAGCGFGDNGIFLAQKGYRVVGFDFSPEAISVDVPSCPNANSTPISEDGGGNFFSSCFGEFQLTGKLDGLFQGPRGGNLQFQFQKKGFRV